MRLGLFFSGKKATLNARAKDKMTSPEEEEGFQIRRHMRVLYERLVLIGERERILLLGKMIAFYYQQFPLGERQRLQWLLYWPPDGYSPFLIPERVLLPEEEPYFFRYLFLEIFLRKLEQSSPLTYTSPNAFLLIKPLSPDYDGKESVVGSYGYHRNLEPVDRANHKLTFDLVDFRLEMREISRASLSWCKRSDFDVCHLRVSTHFQEFKLYLPDQNTITSLTLHIIGLEEEDELPILPFISSDGEFHFKHFLPEKSSYFLMEIRGNFSLSVQGAEKLVITTTSDCHFDIDTCRMELWSRRRTPFPLRFQVKDVDHLRNIERCLRGEPMKHLDEGSERKFHSGGTKGEYYFALERLRMLRRMKVVFPKENYSIPSFFHGNEQLDAVREESKIILYHEHHSFAHCWMNELENRFIHFHLVDFQDSKLINNHSIDPY